MLMQTALMSMPISKIETLSLDGIEYLLVLAGDDGVYDIQRSPGFSFAQFALVQTGMISLAGTA